MKYGVSNCWIKSYYIVSMVLTTVHCASLRNIDKLCKGICEIDVPNMIVLTKDVKVLKNS